VSFFIWRKIMGLFNSISNKIAKSIAKKKSVKLTSYGQQKVKEQARKQLGVDKYVKPAAPKKVGPTLANAMSLPKTSKSVSTKPSSDKKKTIGPSIPNKSGNSGGGSKSSNTSSLLNPYSSMSGTLASSAAPSNILLNPNAKYGINTPMTSSISTSNPSWLSPQKVYADTGNVSGLQNLVSGIGPGAWADKPAVKLLKLLGNVNPLAFIAGNALSTERKVSEELGGNPQSVQDAMGLSSDILTPEVQKAYEEAQKDAVSKGYVDQYGAADMGRYMTAEATEPAPDAGGTPPSGGTGTEGTGTLAGIDTSAGTAWDPSNMPTGEEVFGALKKGMTAEQAAAMDAAIAEYDRQRALLQNQLGFAQQQRQNALDTYGNQYNDVVSQIANARTNAERDTEVGRQNVFDIAQNTQRSNRNVLRSLGILSSSAAGEMLNKPYTEASKQVGSMENQLIQRKKELDDLKIQKDAEFATNVRDLETNYSKMIADIQADIRYTEADKIAAVNQLTAAAQTRYAELQQAQLNWNNQLAAQQQQFALDIARMNAYSGNSITPEMSGILQSSMAVKV
jgi:hypothetical protein